MGAGESARFMRLDFFRTFTGEIKFVGANYSLDRKFWMPMTNEPAREFVEEMCAALISQPFAGSISCEIFRDSGGRNLIAILDRSCLHWNAQRALGVNIPLLYIQDFLKRNFEIVHFVDIGHLKAVGNESIHYGFELGHVFVDLDETLIIENKRVDYVTTFLQRCAEVGTPISLVSRHANDIAESLVRAGIEPRLFNKICPVAAGEMKSDWVTAAKGAVFIDNEFAERLDVRQRKRIPVLDINQLDFFDLAVATGSTPGKRH